MHHVARSLSVSVPANSLLLIDALISEEGGGSRLTDQWEREGLSFNILLGNCRPVKVVIFHRESSLTTQVNMSYNVLKPLENFILDTTLQGRIKALQEKNMTRFLIFLLLQFKIASLFGQSLNKI